MSKFLRIGGRGEDGTAKPILTDDNGRIITSDGQSINRSYTIFKQESVPASDVFETSILSLEKKHNQILDFFMRAEDGRITVTIEAFTSGGSSPSVEKSIKIAPPVSGATGAVGHSTYRFAFDSSNYNRFRFKFEHPSGSAKTIYEFGYVIRDTPLNEGIARKERRLIHSVRESYPTGYIGTVATLGLFQEWEYPQSAEVVAVDTQGNVWLASTTTAYSINRFGDLRLIVKLPTGIKRHAVADSENNVIFGGGDHLIKISQNGETIFHDDDWPGDIRGVDVDQDNNIYVASRDNVLRKVSPTGAVQWSYEGHDDDLYAVASYADGITVSGDNSGTVKKVSADGEATLWTYEGGSGRVNSLTINREGDVFVGHGNNLKKINGDTGVEEWAESLGIGAIFALVSDKMGSIYAGGSSGTIAKYNDETHDVVFSVRAHSDEVRKIALAFNKGVLSAARDGIARSLEPEMQIIGFKNVSP